MLKQQRSAKPRPSLPPLSEKNLEFLYAIESGEVTLALSLLERGGIDVHASFLFDKAEWKLLHRASFKGQEAIVKALLDHGAAVSDCSGREQRSALHVASGEGHLGVATALLAAGANVSAADVDGLKPLHYAANAGHVEVVVLLLERGGSEPDALTTDHWTPLHYACSGGRLAVVETLLAHGAMQATLTAGCRTALHLACMAGALDVVELLLDSGSGGLVNAATLDGRTPLHYAIEKGHEPVARALLARGAKLLNISKEGLTPLDLAISHHQLSMVNFLLSHGVSVESVNPDDGMRPLHLACMVGDEAIAHALLVHGASVHAVEKYQRTPLHLASTRPIEGVVKCLLSFGARVDGVDRKGWTPLHFACQKSLDGVVDLLLKNGANVSVCASAPDAVTPLLLSAANGRTPSLETYLLRMSQEWRPSFHGYFPTPFQAAVSTIVALWSWDRGTNTARHPESGFADLPLEILDEIFIWMAVDIVPQGYLIR